MSTQSEALKERTIRFAADILGLIDDLPKTSAGRVVADQLARSASGAAANYRQTCTARSRKEFIARLGVVLEETDESLFWLELIQRRALGPQARVTDLLREALELRAIIGKSLGTARENDRLRREDRSFSYAVKSQ